MAKKKNNSANANAGDEGPVNGEEKNAAAGGGGKKKTESPNEPFEVVLKTEIHCEGCASKLTKLSRSFSGVESAKADTGLGKLTVAGRVDPAQLREYLAQKTKKKVDVVSPQPKNKEDKKKDDKKPEDEEDKKEKEKKKKDDKKPQLTTAMIKMSLHCQGCIEKIHKIVSKTAGVEEVFIDKQKEVVVVKGTMDVKALVETLKERFKRNVEVLPPPKKEKEEVDNAGGGGGGKKKKKGGGGGGGGGDEKENGGAGEMIMVGENRMDSMMQQGFAPGYGFMDQPVNAPGFVGQYVNAPGFVGQPVYGNGTVGQPIYGNGYMGQPVYGYGPDNGYQVPGYPAHMKFNDENPNACTVM